MYKINWTPGKVEKAIEMLSKYFKSYGPGECILQSDSAIIEAPELLSNIADEVLVEGEGLIYEHNND